MLTVLSLTILTAMLEILGVAAAGAGGEAAGAVLVEPVLLGEAAGLLEVEVGLLDAEVPPDEPLLEPLPELGAATA